jgi:hypothetical protein
VNQRSIPVEEDSFALFHSFVSLIIKVFLLYSDIKVSIIYTNQAGFRLCNHPFVMRVLTVLDKDLWENRQSMPSWGEM